MGKNETAGDKPANVKLYRFKPDQKVFYKKNIYRTTNHHGTPDFLDITVPMAPNHHFIPVGEVEKFKGQINVKRSEALEKVHTKLEELEAETFEKDRPKGKVFWMEAFKIMESKNVNDPSKVLEALKPKEEPKK